MSRIAAATDHFWQELKLIDGPARWVFWAIGVVGVWNYQQEAFSIRATPGLLLYLALNILVVPALPRAGPNARRYLAVILYITDLLFVSFIIYQTGGLVSQFFLLYCLLIFKAALYYPYVHRIILVPFLIFPLYITTLYLNTGTLVFLQDQLFVSRYALLLVVIFVGLYTAWHLDSRHRHTRALLEQLGIEHQRIDERHRELRAVLDSIGDGVIVVDRGLHLLMINPVAADIFNVSYPQSPGTPLLDLIDSATLLDLLGQALEVAAVRDAPISDEIRALPRSSSKPIICQALATALVGRQDVPHGAVVVLRDMTRQKELEESKTNFISMLSHELRTPLTAIRGFVDLILSGSSGDITQQQQEYLNIVFDQSEHLQSLINALLEFAEMEVGETSLDPDILSLEQLVSNALGQIQSLADQRGITLEAQIPSDLPPLYADGKRLERVLFNLLDNAVKFSPKQGQVKVSISDKESEVLICIADTGGGVPPAEQERIFERFYQVDNSTTREHGGTGLGLALCKHIVEMHQGQIWVEPIDEQETRDAAAGSRFCFTIPRDLGRQIESMTD